MADEFPGMENPEDAIPILFWKHDTTMLAQFTFVIDEESESGVSLDVQHRDELTRGNLLELLDEARECIRTNPWLRDGEDNNG